MSHEYKLSNPNCNILGFVKNIIIFKGVSKALFNLSLVKISLPSVKSVIVNLISKSSRYKQKSKTPYSWFISS